MEQSEDIKEPAEWVNPYPNLDDVVQFDDVAQKGGGNFKADYVNWARISHYLRVHAPGWQPFMERRPVALGGNEPFHIAPDGSVYLLIGFRHPDPTIPDTEVVVHAIMDARNNAKKADDVDARDISDAFVRGMCKAAALLFGLGWKLWSKDDPMSRDDDKLKKATKKHTTKPVTTPEELEKPSRPPNQTEGGAVVTIGAGNPEQGKSAEEGDLWVDYAEDPARVLRKSEGQDGHWEPQRPNDPPYTAAHKTVANMLIAQAKTDEITTAGLFTLLAEADGAASPVSRFSEVSIGALARTLNELNSLPF